MANYAKFKGIGINILIMFIITGVSFYYLFYIYLPSTTNHGEMITVPELTGTNVNDVKDIIGNSSLQFEVVDSSAFNPTKKPLSVLNQVPKAGSKVKENRKIYLTINARNAPKVEMPNLKDMGLRNARITLKSMGLEEGNTIYKPYIFRDVIIAQSYNGEKIAAGEFIPKGSKIDLIVGNGARSNEVPIPNLVGRNYEDLEKYLEQYGLLLSPPNWEINEDMPVGKVFKQSPAFPDSNSTLPTTVQAGSIIDVWVSGEAPSDSTITNE